MPLPYACSHDFKRQIEAMREARLGEAPLELSVRSIEWHSVMHRFGQDELLDACSPGIPPSLSPPLPIPPSQVSHSSICISSFLLHFSSSVYCPSSIPPFLQSARRNCEGHGIRTDLQKFPRRSPSARHHGPRIRASFHIREFHFPVTRRVP